MKNSFLFASCVATLLAFSAQDLLAQKRRGPAGGQPPAGRPAAEFGTRGGRSGIRRAATAEPVPRPGPWSRSLI